MLEDIINNFKSLTKKEKIITYSFVFVITTLSFYIFLKTPPLNFPINTVLTIEEGESLQKITNYLEKENIVRFPIIFRSAVIIMGGERSVIAGDYLLDKREGPIALAYRLVKGQFHLDVLKITIPEGWNIFEIGNHLEKKLKNFNKNEFIALSTELEGYLFPDTYFIPDTARPKFVINMMRSNFEDQIKNINGLATTTKTLNEILTMASILEGEANTTESRKIVAGILWKRLATKMPLQVDATFSYINGKGTSELTLDDLKIDSPYNTYKYKGLPPGPISNPGIDAINSALYPTTTKYLYFLTGKDGKMYYGKNFEEHKRNKEKYIYN